MGDSVIYNRKALAKHYNISQSKLRRILKALQIQPELVVKNSRGLPIYYYSQITVEQLNKYFKLLQQKLQNKLKRCCVCKKLVPQSNMVGTRCMDCFVKKSCTPIVYGKNWWQRAAQVPVIQKAVQYLKKFIPGPR